MDKRVLILGATGFIGTHLVESAKESSFEIFAAYRKEQNYPILKKNADQLIKIDFEDLPQLRKNLETHSFDAIVYNAGLTSANGYEDYKKVNCDYLIELLQLIKKLKKRPEKLVYISSLAAMGPAEQQKDQILRPDSPLKPISHYGKSKAAAEFALQNQCPIPYCIIRPTAVYGPRDKGLLDIFKALNRRLNIQISTKAQELSFIYVKDLSRLILLAIEHAEHKNIFLAANAPVYSANNFNKVIKKQLGKKSLKIKLPFNFVRLIAVLNEKLSKLTGKHPKLDREKLKEITSHSWKCDVSNLSKINYKSEYNLQQGICETIQWYKHNHWI